MFVTKTLLSLLLKSIGTVNIDLPFLLIAVITFVIFIAIIYITSVIVGNKAGKVKSVDAIRYGESPVNIIKNQFVSLSQIKNIPFAIGLKSLFSQKRRTALNIIAIALTSFVLFFAVNTINSFKSLITNFPFWGFPDAHIGVTRGGKRADIEHERFMEYLKSEDKVKAFLPAVLMEVAVPVQGDKVSQNIFGNVCEGDMNSVGLINVEGRHPETGDEISIGVTTSKYYNKKIGDPFDVFIEGRRRTFTVVGIFQTANSLGHGFRMQVDGYKTVDPLFEPSYYYIVLKDKKDVKNFIFHLESKFGEAIDAEDLSALDSAPLQQIVSNMFITFTFASLILLIVSFVSIFNSTQMDIQESRKIFGIFKTIGLTPLQLRLSVVYKADAIALMGLIIGAILYIFLSPLLLNKLFSTIGVVTFPIKADIIGSILIIPFILLFCAMSAWLPSGNILKVSPRTLIVE